MKTCTVNSTVLKVSDLTSVIIPDLWYTHVYMHINSFICGHDLLGNINCSDWLSLKVYMPRDDTEITEATSSFGYGKGVYVLIEKVKDF